MSPYRVQGGFADGITLRALRWEMILTRRQESQRKEVRLLEQARGGAPSPAAFRGEGGMEPEAGRLQGLGPSF